MNMQRAKDLFFKLLIVSLVAAASVAVVAVLLGEFNEALRNSLLTIFMMVIHSSLSIGFIANNEEQNNLDNLPVFTNATFGALVLSFGTSVLGIWDVISGDFVGNLYMLYFVLLFAVLHGEVLGKTLGMQKGRDKLVYINYVFMAAVVLLLVPVIFAEDTDILGSLYFRILAACSIIDATLTLLIAIFHKIYLDKHPKVIDPIFNMAVQTPAQQGQSQVAGQPTQPQPVMVPHKRMSVLNVLLIVLFAYIGFQMLVGILFALIGGAFF